MKINRFSKSYNYKAIYQDVRRFKTSEGAIEYTAQRDNRDFYIIDSTTMSEFIDDLDDVLITVIEFNSKEEYREFLYRKKNL